MPRLGVTITQEMQQALEKESDKTGAPVAALVRMAIEEFLKVRGWEIETNVNWGGHRKSKREEE